MANLMLQYTASASPDVVRHWLYYAPSGDESLALDSPRVELPGANPGDRVAVELSGLLPEIDGVYDLGVVAEDDVGNLSPMVRAEEVAVDFVPPLPVTDLSVFSDS